MGEVARSFLPAARRSRSARAALVLVLASSLVAATNPPNARAGAPSITAGSYYSLALNPDGSVLAWGANGLGQLGDGTQTHRRKPVSAALGASVAVVAAGGRHTLAATADGALWGWGANESGQLGTEKGQSLETKPKGKNVFEDLALRVKGTVEGGATLAHEVGVGEAVGVAAGGRHTLVLKRDGTIWALGRNGAGQLGDGTKTDRSGAVLASGLTGGAAIAAGDSHSVAVKTDGTVWSWGENGYGQLGDGSRKGHPLPAPVSGLDGVAGIAAGNEHTVALRRDGTVCAWGYNSQGQLGDGTETSRTTPGAVKGLAGEVVAIAAGGEQTLALTRDGTVYAWGANSHGELGDGTQTHRSVPVKVSGLAGVKGIAAGREHSLAFKEDGTVWAWGRNNYGQLGDGTTTDRLAPVQVAGPQGGFLVLAPGAPLVARETQGIPPSLSATVSFQEPSGNRVLDALEEGVFLITLENTGKGDAVGVVVKAVWEKEPKAVRLAAETPVGRVGPGKRIDLKIPVVADEFAPDQKLKVTFFTAEGHGFDADPVAVSFETRSFAPPNLVLADFGIDDASGNGQVEPGEVVEVVGRVQNKGPGDAVRVSAALETGENVFLAAGSKAEVDLGNLLAGEQRDFRFSFYTNKRVKSGEKLPLVIHLREGRGRFYVREPLPIAVNAPQRRTQEVVVEGAARPDKAGGGKDSSAASLSVDVDQNIPAAKTKNPDAVAVVMGIADYQHPGVPRVEYAKRDATKVREYLVKALGYDERNILPRDPDQPLTAGAMKTLVRQVLPSYLKKGKSDVFVYYSGHGAPSTATQEGFLVPADGNPDYVSEDNAYSLRQFEEDLTKLDSRSLVIVLDACFSGQSGAGTTLIHNASPALLKVVNPIVTRERAVVLASAKADQVSNWYPEKKHGMFTYFFLKGLQGAADQNKDRQVTVEEMERYLLDEDEGIPYWSLREFQRVQTPQVTGRDKSLVLVKY